METITFKNKQYNIIEKYKNNKIHVEFKNKHFVIVPFNTYNAFSAYLSNKKMLKKYKVEISKVLKKDKKGLMILEQYIDGIPVIKILADNDFDEKCINELFRIYRNNRFAKIALDYKPENFVKHKKYFYYIDDSIYQYTDRTAFEKSEDIYLYIGSDAQERYIKSRGYQYKDRIQYKGGELNKQIVLFCVAHW